MSERLDKLYQHMEDQQMDLLLITHPKNIFYVTGFHTEPHERFLGLLIPSEGEPILIVPELDLDTAAEKSSVTRIITHSDHQNPYDLLKQVLPSRIQKLGLEKEHLTMSRFEAISAVAEARLYEDVGGLLQKMRMIKTPDEIARIRRAIQIAETALGEGLKQVTTGVTERDIAAEIDYQRRKSGADGGGLMVVSGEKSALPHGRTGDRKIQHGDLLLFDMGVIKDGYVSDISRTFAVGDIDDRRRDIYETVLAANLAAIAAVKPGERFGHLDATARSLIAQKGYGPYFTHRLGHGMGMINHEYPSIHGDNPDLLAPGMVFTIEPGIYVPDTGGVRIEDDVVVTETGVEVLTHFPKELRIL